MKKVSYIGNGENREFFFSFPYYENSDVIVTKNGATATGYNIAGNPGGLDADFPFIGGCVVFDIAPTPLDSIVISRNLPLQRQYDYQPLAKLNPTELNQDANYLMEVIKDLKDELDDLIQKYQDITDKESTETLLSRITEIHKEIVAIDAKITALGDVSLIRSDITNLQTVTNNLVNSPKCTMPDLSQSVTMNDGDTLPCDAFVYWSGSGMGDWKTIGIIANGSVQFSIASLYAVKTGVFLPSGTTITRTEGTTSVQYFPLN